MQRKLHRIWFVLMIVLYQYTRMVRSNLPEELRFPLLQKVIPESYEVIINHNTDDLVPNYSGDVRIEVHCMATTKTVSFNHAGSVRVNDVKVKKLLGDDADSQFTVIGMNGLSGNQRELTLNKPLEAYNRYEIKIKFSNTFSFVGTGYFFKEYQKDGSAPKFMTFTKLNEFDARRVFPCLDQINLKATFKMCLVHPKRLKGFSNAKLESSDDINDRPGWVKDVFHKTMNMSTFSIAMALLPIEFQTTGYSSALVKVQTWADGDVIHRMTYINELASTSFQFFSILFKKPHPLKKLDIIILPDVDFDVQESFGLIFMSQKYVLDTLEKSSNPTTYAMVTKICHAVSYQWIGCSVTMSKWQDTWLHQGLNYFLQEQCAKKIFPEYPSNILEQNMIESFLAFMRSEEIGVYDKPITILRSYPHLDFMKFVTLEKVYHLVRMIHFMTGPTLFNRSLETYVHDFMGLNSELDDVLDVFTRKANSVTPKIFPDGRYTVPGIIKSWLQRTGVPLIKAKRDDDVTEIILKQKIFNSLELDVDYKNYDDGYWIIPLSCTTEKESEIDVVAPRVWLMNARIPWSPPVGFGKDDYILCNLEFNVPGRVLYDEKTWNLIHKFFVHPDAKFMQISVLTRARIVSDMFTLAEAAKLTYKIALSTMTYLRNEEELLPWSIALKEFDLIRSRLLGSDLALFERYQEFVREILKPFFKKQITQNFWTYPTEETLESRFKILLLEISCKFDLQGCLEKSSELKNMWDRTSNQGKELKIRRRLYKVVLCEQIKHENKNKWDILWKSYFEEEQQSSKEDLLQAFACSRKTEDLERYHSQITMGSHSEGEPSQLFYLRILFDATNRRRDLNEISKFARLKDVSMFDTLTNKSIDNARRNITWAHRKKSELRKFLNNISYRKLVDNLKNKFKFR